MNLLFTYIPFYVCKYITIFLKILKSLVSYIQNLQNAKFYSCFLKAEIDVVGFMQKKYKISAQYLQNYAC